MPHRARPKLTLLYLKMQLKTKIVINVNCTVQSRHQDIVYVQIKAHFLALNLTVGMTNKLCKGE